VDPLKGNLTYLDNKARRTVRLQNPHAVRMRACAVLALAFLEFAWGDASACSSFPQNDGTYYWAGGASNWDGKNWCFSRALCYLQDILDGPTIVIGGGTVFLGRVIDNLGGTVTINSGGILTVTAGGLFQNYFGGTVTINSGGILAVTAGGLFQNYFGTLTINAGGTVDISAGELYNDFGGTVTINSGGVLTISGGNFKNGECQADGGTLAINPGGTMIVSGGGFTAAAH